MGSLAQLAVEKGLKVTGCDQNVYPPMSDQLEAAGIGLIQGYAEEQLALKPDVWVIGNAMSRGNPLVEAILNAGENHVSGPEFLRNQILGGQWVMAVAGTHGKTSTSSMLAWVLEHAGFEPGFLIGGVPVNFGVSARLGKSDFFVIEADEYDTAFFDKRSKFVHYKPRTLILNNLEFDHADIFNDLAAIERQFHQLIRTVPSQGQILVNAEDANLQRVLNQGCWSELQTFGESGRFNGGLSAEPDTGLDWSISKSSRIGFQSKEQGTLNWSQLGKHNRMNALSVIAAVRSIGIEPATAIEALGEFRGIKRRMELIGKTENAHIYDDFAHHPTAIETTLRGLRASVGDHDRIVAVIEPRSNTMKMGVFVDSLLQSGKEADRVYWFQPDQLEWSLTDMIRGHDDQTVESDFECLLDSLANEAQRGGHIVIMSNGSFMGIREKLIERLSLESVGHQRSQR